MYKIEKYYDHYVILEDDKILCHYDTKVEAEKELELIQNKKENIVKTNQDNKRYNNYHKHTYYSNLRTLDCIVSPEEYIKRAVELGHTTYFTGEHGFQGNLFETQVLCEKYGIKPIYSVEAYYVDDISNKEDRKAYHIILVGMTEKARYEINKIMSIANTDGFYYKPRIGLKELLSLTPTDTIVTSACFVKGNRVLTKKGYKNIENITREDFVKNKYGKWEQVNYPTRIDYIGDGYEIKIEGFTDKIVCTQDHKFLTTSHNDIHANKMPKWMTAEELNIKRSNSSKPILLYPIDNFYSNNYVLKKQDWNGCFKNIEHDWSIKQSINKDVIITNELMRMFGFFIGNGHITLKGNIRVGFTIHKDQYEHLKSDIFDRVEEQLGIKFNITQRPSHKRVDLSTSSVDFINLMYYLFGGCKAESKHIPDRLLHISEDLDKELALGMILADGHLRQTKKDHYTSCRLTYVTISKILSEQILTLFSDIGLKPTILEKDGYVDNNLVNHQNAYYIDVNAKKLSNISRYESIDHDKWTELLNELYTESNSSPFVVLNGIKYKKVQIRDIKKININEDVYCLNNDSHSFVLNGCVVHNCIASRLSSMLIYENGNFVRFGNVEEQKECLENFLYPLMNHFGKNLYLEVQDHKSNQQIVYNKMILALHNQFKIPLIHANDSHYIHEGDSYYRDLFLAAKGMRYDDENGFILDYPDYDTILERYRMQGVLTEEQAVEALNNTLIFDNAEAVYTDKEFKIPKISNEYIQQELGSPNFSNEDSDRVLQEIVLRSWSKKKDKVKQSKIKDYKEAILYEMDIIKKCGMADYFILDHMIVDRAVKKYNAVLTRSGRGSAVSFLTNNLLGLTEVDRIKAPTRLYPTRFMSAERILNSRSLPDIDLNFSDVEPVIQASKDILGEDGIYYMVAWKPLQRSSAFRLWCKARGYDINEYNDIATNLADKSYTDEMFVEDYPKWKTEFEYSKKFRGVIESVAPSPCSFLLSNDPISEKVGLMKVGDQITCCLDGYYCDYFKFLKNDYLVVKIYDIIDKTYKLIGRPIDDISTLVNNCDDKVWDIYEKGLTTTINQADSDFGKQSIMRYKPRNLAELSAWVAAIRPGFASLLNTFLDRQPYTTGVKELDDLLKDSFHFMMYQESIMAYLVWLGIEEKGTYDIIKKIAKKKFKEEELNELKEKLLKGWVKNVGKEEGFAETWQVVEDAARYSFNASHALSVGVDSLYGAYLKSHYPLEYFTVVLTLYADDMDRTAKLIDELKYFGISIKNIKFGKSSSEYKMDKETNSIYKGISSIKFCNAQIADELYELSKNHYDTFVDLLMDINEKTSVNSRQLMILTALGFFEEFGKNQYLLNLIELCNGRAEDKKKGIKAKPSLLTCKQLKKDKLEEYGISDYLCKKYCSKETLKQYSQIDNLGLIKELATRIENRSLNIVNEVKFQLEYLEYCIYANPNISDRYYIITDFKTYKNPATPYLFLHNLNTGEDIKTRITKGSIFKDQPFGLYSILKVDNFTKKNKVKNVNGSWVKSETEFEDILENYEVISKN